MHTESSGNTQEGPFSSWKNKGYYLLSKYSNCSISFLFEFKIWEGKDVFCLNGRRSKIGICLPLIFTPILLSLRLHKFNHVYMKTIVLCNLFFKYLKGLLQPKSFFLSFQVVAVWMPNNFVLLPCASSERETSDISISSVRFDQLS